jgi:hypothetical protein
MTTAHVSTTPIPVETPCPRLPKRVLQFIPNTEGYTAFTATSETASLTSNYLIHLSEYQEPQHQFTENSRYNTYIQKNKILTSVKYIAENRITFQQGIKSLALDENT